MLFVDIFRLELKFLLTGLLVLQLLVFFVERPDTFQKVGNTLGIVIVEGVRNTLVHLEVLLECGKFDEQLGLSLEGDDLTLQVRSERKYLLQRISG